MPNTLYKIKNFGHPVEDGVSQAIHIGVNGIAKKSSIENPNIIFNELLSSKIGQVLLLPIPPGFLIESENDKYFASLNFNLAGHNLPPVNTTKIIQNHPQLVWGVLLFDALILNYDRHKKNIAYFESKNKVQIFDHDRSFISTHTDYETIKFHLEGHEETINYGNHCLANKINTTLGLDYWIFKIKSIPDYFIKELINSFNNLGLNHDVRKFSVDFFINRKNNIKSLVLKNKLLFPKISNDMWEKIENDSEY